MIKAEVLKTCSCCKTVTKGYCLKKLDRGGYEGVSLAIKRTNEAGTGFHLIILEDSPFENVKRYQLAGADPLWFCSNVGCGLQIEDSSGGCPRCDNPSDGNLCLHRLHGLSYEKLRVDCPADSHSKGTAKAAPWSLRGPDGVFTAWFCKACGHQVSGDGI